MVEPRDEDIQSEMVELMRKPEIHNLRKFVCACIKDVILSMQHCLNKSDQKSQSRALSVIIWVGRQPAIVG